MNIVGVGSCTTKVSSLGKETNEVGRRIVSGGCHPAERKKRRLCGSPAAVTRRRGAGWRRWRLVSRRIVLFPTTACSSINRR
ncbi:unnamed protein product [Spirodela intermedia]|uniref:Uncharacterized protein n=1 Tax=Spirodela intermedia TaxID=51605 RepID=A0ABN7EAF8_SPIIN|nr:unnamed protein product [Spirodela intermedia]